MATQLQRSVMIEKLSEGTTAETVHALVTKKLIGGEIEECVVNDKGRIAYVIFKDKGTVGEAIDSLHHEMFEGQKLTVGEVPKLHYMIMAGLLKLQQESKPQFDLAQLVLQLQSLNPDQQAEVTAAASWVSGIKIEQPEAAGGLVTQLSAAGLANIPKLPFFSGDTGSKGEVSYQQWSCEARSLQKDGVKHSLILQSARRSLRGTAATILLQLGDGASVESMLDKLDLFFGNILSVEELYRQFYTAEQMETELVGTWALRVEDLLSNLAKKDPSVALPQAKEQMLRSRFFVGLLPQGVSLVKSTIRHKFDSGATYHQLVLDARTAELEGQSARAKTKAKVHQESVTIDNSMGKKLDQILAQMGKMDALAERVKKIEEQQTAREEKASSSGKPSFHYNRSNNSQGERKPFMGRCFGCGQPGHRRDTCPANS
jgi:hypothetical protein